MEFLVIILLIAAFISVAFAFDYFSKQAGRVNSNLEKLERLKQELEKQEKHIEKSRADVKQLARELSLGFPLLAKAYEEYFKLQDGKISNFLDLKKNPAHKAAELVRAVSAEKREALRQKRIFEYLIEYYETLAPFLLDAKGELMADFESRETLREYTQEEQEDAVTYFVTKEEYRKLSVGERNQLALDRYWSKGNKSLWTLGKMYEHYVGYLYEQDGWEVEYFGIKEKYEDFGRDLIVHKGRQCHIIQCKNWSRFKTVYENHIFQLFGTSYEYKKAHPRLKVTPVFYTTTQLSEAAKEFARRLGMVLKDNFKLKSYPCIKCNISRLTGEKIYHLPFDQQYDTAKVESTRGEFYAMTVKEAESKGFRRAWRWRGNRET